jgi:hypothetical protein
MISTSDELERPSRCEVLYYAIYRTLSLCWLLAAQHALQQYTSVIKLNNWVRAPGMIVIGWWCDAVFSKTLGALLACLALVVDGEWWLLVSYGQTTRLHRQCCICSAWHCLAKCAFHRSLHLWCVITPTAVSPANDRAMLPAMIAGTVACEQLPVL